MTAKVQASDRFPAVALNGQDRCASIPVVGRLEAFGGLAQPPLTALTGVEPPTLARSMVPQPVITSCSRAAQHGFMVA